MSVRVTFNNKEYELIYNEQSGLYEIELEAPKIGGIYNAEITFTDSIENIETSTTALTLTSFVILMLVLLTGKFMFNETCFPTTSS